MSRKMSFHFEANVFLLLMIISLVGCSQHNLSQHDVIGEYTIDYKEYGKGTETLILNTNGTYEQILIISSGKVLKNTGNWEYRNPRSNQEQIWLYSAFTPMNYGPKKINKEDRALFASSFGGNIYLEIHPDVADKYKKVH